MTTKDVIEQEFEEILLNHLAADQRQIVLAYVARERRKAFEDGCSRGSREDWKWMKAEFRQKAIEIYLKTKQHEQP